MHITVQTYAGYRADERLVSFTIENRILRIVEILDRWYDPDYSVFKVLTDDGRIYLLHNNMNAGAWELDDTVRDRCISRMSRLAHYYGPFSDAQ